MGEPGDGPDATPGTAGWWKSRHSEATRRRPRSDGLTVERITAAALTILDREGLDALTMRRLAAELGSGAASLYRHVANREELLIVVTDHVLGEVGSPPPGVTWREGAAYLAREFRRVLQRHPAVVQLLPHDRLLGPNAMRGREKSLRGLIACGFPLDAVASIHATLVAWVMGYSLLSAHAAGTQQARTTRRDMYGSVDPVEYPTVQRLATSEPTSDDDDVFEVGLVTLLDGIEARYGIGRHGSD